MRRRAVRSTRRSACRPRSSAASRRSTTSTSRSGGSTLRYMNDLAHGRSWAFVPVPQYFRERADPRRPARRRGGGKPRPAHRDAGRRLHRHRRGPAAQQPVGSRADVLRGARHFDPGVRDRAAIDPRVRRAVALAAERRLARIRCPLPPLAGSPRSPCRIPPTSPAWCAVRPSRCSPSPFIRTGARQGAADAHRGAAPCAASRDDAPRVVSRPGLRERAHRFDHHRIGVRPARHRPILPHRSDQPRLHAGGRASPCSTAR